MPKHRPIAIYLPQFHPIPENDEWWGKGFTEWTNVTKAKPLFKGHYQPQLPTDMGFYDLRLNESFYEQIALAKEAGIYGFMFYEYWFSGKRVLEKPLDNFLNDINIDFPFCLCWANENWTKRWDGHDEDILLKQTYSEEDFKNHFSQVYAKFFKDDRYIKVNGNPVLCIYKTSHIPNIKLLTKLWKEETRALGFKDLYIIRCENNGDELNPTDIGCDAAYEFHPKWNEIEKYRVNMSLLNKLINELPSKKISNIFKRLIKKEFNNFFDLEKYTNYQINKIQKEQKYIRFPGIMPSWDNTPRRSNGNAYVFIKSSPELYGKWLKHILTNINSISNEENFLFINAWNEWAEGCHLEPCNKYGKSYLLATKKILEIYNH